MLPVFLTAYAHTWEADHAENKSSMQLEWTIKNGFPKLAKTIDNAILYTHYVQAPIPNNDAVDTIIKMLMSNCLFERQ